MYINGTTSTNWPENCLSNRYEMLPLTFINGQTNAVLNSGKNVVYGNKTLLMMKEVMSVLKMEECSNTHLIS